MSTAEMFYRVNQYVQKNREKKDVNLFHKKQDFHKVFLRALKRANNCCVFPINIAEFQFSKIFNFFDQSVDLNNELDWHFDPRSGKRFPLIFSKNIDIRSDKYGSAKVVWEINRLQFLLPLAIQYNVSKDKKELDLWIQLITSWVKANPYLKGVNWYSNIEVNIRLIIWYFCWQVLWQNEDLKKNEEFVSFVTDTWLPSIYEHCVYSYKNPSRFSSANNHLVAEYSGLFVAASCWNFEESEVWKTYALKGLEEEIVKQHSGNGINREEAAEYIQFITDFFLIPYAIGTKTGIPFSYNYKDYLFRISEYLINLLDAKKGYRKYGDEDDGKVLIVSNDPHFDNFSSLLTSAAVLFDDERFKGVGQVFDLKNWLLWGQEGFDKFNSIKSSPHELKTAFYKEEGHFIFRKVEKTDISKEIYLHFDAASLGFLSIAAHGHADALSIVLHVDGDPILVDVGTYTYHTDKEWRNYFISTLAHNTICIDGENQALQAGPTMWLRHYKAEVLETVQDGSMERVSASHSGYNRLGCSHQRTVSFNREKERFTIIDEVGINKKLHKVFQPWHIHPAVEVERINANTFFLMHKKGNRKIKISYDTCLDIQLKRGETNPVLGWYSKSFLQKEPINVIIGSYAATAVRKIELTTLIEII